MPDAREAAMLAALGVYVSKDSLGRGYSGSAISAALDAFLAALPDDEARVERAAQALALHAQATDAGKWAAAKEWWRESYRDEARAVLRALRAVSVELAI